jgi:glutaredoxin 3
MANVTVYTADWCPYCVRAKRLLSEKGIEFTDVNVDKEPGKREELVRKTGHKTNPMIFINDQFIGGFSELSALDEKGELEQMTKS